MANEQSGGFGSPSRRMAFAARLFHEGHPAAQCAEIASSAAMEEPTEANLVLLALYRLHAGQLEEAYAAANRLRTGREIRTANALGLLFTAKQRDEDARTGYREAMESAPDFAPAYRNLAFHSLLHGRYEDAVVNRVRALVVARIDRVWYTIHRFPDNMPKFFCDRAEADAKLEQANPAWGRVWEACNTIERAESSVPPEAIEPLGELGDLEWLRPALRAACVMLRDWDEAATDLRRALALSPKEPSVLSALWQRTQPREATLSEVRILSQLLRLCPRWLKGNVDFARVLYRRRKKTEAIQHLDLVISRVPDYFLAIQWRYFWRADRGDLKGALEDVQRLIKLLRADEFDSYEEEEDVLEPRNQFDRLLARAELYARLGNRDLSDLEYDRTLELARRLDERTWVAPTMLVHVTRVHMHRAKCYFEQKRYAEALLDYDAALDDEVMYMAEILLERAACKEAMGDKAGAEEDRREAAALRVEEEENYRRMTEPDSPEPE